MNGRTSQKKKLQLQVEKTADIRGKYIEMKISAEYDCLTNFQTQLCSHSLYEKLLEWNPHKTFLA